jgi:uncharacterized membrane protein
MKSAAVLSALFSAAFIFIIWLTSIDAWINRISTAAAIISDTSSASTQAFSVCLPPALISFHSFKTRKFTFAAAILSFICGVLLLSSGLQYFGAVLTFYVLKSTLILYIWRRKLYIGGSNHPYPPLDVCRILVKGLGPALISMCKLVLMHDRAANSNCINCRIADVAFLSYVACCAGHGFSTELASVRFAKPRLITTWRSVMPGVSGGVTPLGTVASALGGGVIGIAFCAFLSFSSAREMQPMESSTCYKYHLILGMLAGLLGSCFSCLLGATLMYSGVDTVSNKVVSNPNGASIEHITGIDLLNASQMAFFACSLTSASFAVVAWFKFSH